MKTKAADTIASSQKKTSSNLKSSKDTLENIFQDMLKDMYWAEKHVLKALPKMAKASHHEELREAFDSHLEQTQLQIQRIEDCFDLMDVKATAKKCEAMEGLVKEGEETIGKYAEGFARDAALIAAVQKIEHYEISSYGTMRTMAKVLGKVQCAELLEESKDEEAETDERLTEIAEKINQLAAEMAEQV